ncbi:MAG: sigma 54-interacting transcriptional regulator [Reinekea sp.]
MKNWLKHAVSLTEVSDRAELVQRYTAALCQLMPLSRAWVLAPDLQGAQLEMVGIDSSPAFKVNDFDHPFSHVLRAPAPMLLDDSQLPYWQKNADFTGQIAKRERDDGVLITPLPPNASKIRVLLMVLGKPATLDTLANNICWNHFNTLFTNCWQMLSELSREVSQRSVLKASINHIRLKEHRQGLSQSLQSQLIGSSKVMHSLRSQIVVAAQSQLNVLVQGETGTGKELVAKAIHDVSPRQGKPFVAINCAAIPESLLESELFGHVKGAFSGADRNKPGLFAQADGGTLFLDEIGDLPLPLQAKLLRVLESRCFRPVGGKEEIEVDFRLVAATHVALRARTQEQLFRQDLYYRLEQFPIRVPTLYQRTEDLPELVRHFVSLYNQRRDTRITGVQNEVFEWLSQHAFPGNIRELRNLIEYACALTGNDEDITLEKLLSREMEPASVPVSSGNAARPGHAPIASASLITTNDLKQAVQSFEYNLIRSRLDTFDGNRSMTAKSLGIPKRTLAHKCLKLEIE